MKWIGCIDNKPYVYVIESYYWDIQLVREGNKWLIDKQLTNSQGDLLTNSLNY